jgi:predicted DNA-binding protein (MmcQ/YjbR family)
MFGDFYRKQYPGTVVRGYHCPPVQQPYWNTIHMNGTVPDEELRIMIDHAYQAVVDKLPKRVQKEILE